MSTLATGYDLHTYKNNISPVSENSEYKILVNI